ncbi:MAG: class I SAM-dependent methyltransferase [Candidatus Paceibacterota bacterium]|jgi:ubiquinone/menaquinone biosynthesis C-methylase UbiE
MTHNTPLDKYIEQAKDAPPRPLLVEAVGYVDDKGEALDLGAGALNDSRHLLSIGFKRVTAVDMDEASKEKAKTFSFAGFTFVHSTYAEFKFPKERYDLVNAQYALPFNPPDTFNEVFEKIIGSMKKGGVFTGQFFGDRDSWNVRDGKKTFHTIEEAKRLLSKMNIVEFREDEGDQANGHGIPAHWHVFHFIVIK